MTTAPSNDFYEILGVERAASQSEIKSAWLKLVWENHPDRNSGPEAEEATKRINAAHDILSDPDKRAKYDREQKQQEAQEQPRRPRQARRETRGQQRWHSGSDQEAREQKRQRQRDAQEALNRQRGQAQVLLTQALRELGADDSDLDFDLKQEIQIKIDMLRSWLGRNDSSAAQIANACIILANTLERVRTEALKRQRRRQSDPKVAAAWRLLQNRYKASEPFDAHVTGSNSGGLIVDIGRIEAFIPISQITAAGDRKITASQLTEYIGRTLRVKAIEVDRARNRAILSERKVSADQRAEQKQRIFDKLHVGDILEGRVTRIEHYGVFVDIGGTIGLAHISELSWDFVKHPADLFAIGQTVQVCVVEIDREAERINLSVRRAATGSWDQTAARFEIGQVVPATVFKLTKAKAFIRLDGPVEGAIHVSELTGRYVSHVSGIVAVGDVIPVKILSIDPVAKHVHASLQQARAEAERAGWIFRADGGIARLPDDIVARFSGAQPSSTDRPFDEPPGATSMSEALKRAQAERERKKKRPEKNTAERRQQNPDAARMNDGDGLEQYRARFLPAKSDNGHLYKTYINGWELTRWVGKRQGEISACVFAPRRWSESGREYTSESNLIDETCGDLDEAFRVLWRAEQSGEIVSLARGAIGAHNATL